MKRGDGAAAALFRRIIRAARALERVDRSVKRENRRIPRDVPRNTREGDREPSTVRARATRTASIE